MINNHRNARGKENSKLGVWITGVWKIQIPMPVDFISSKDTGETCTIYV